MRNNGEQDPSLANNSFKKSTTLNNEDCLQDVSKIPPKLSRKKIPKIQNNTNGGQGCEAEKQNSSMFKRKYTKTKKIIGEKEGTTSQNRIMISTSGSCNAKRNKKNSNYNTNIEHVESDRKSLNSAKPVSNTLQEVSHRHQ